jgi:hypothetical protein
MDGRHDMPIGIMIDMEESMKVLFNLTAAVVAMTAVGAWLAPAAYAAPVKTCVEEEPAEKPNPKFTEVTTTEQRSACPSNSQQEPISEETVVENPSGNQPPGQQPE